MKIQCDVCDKAEASVFCTADEAALCDACDHRVHHANKLASKHQRFSLLHPSSTKQFPLCDVCQEKRAFLFCQQDRAILCRDCDVPIHTANEHTKEHNRFLLTGVKLSATAAVYTPPSGDSVPDFKFHPLKMKPVSVSPVASNPSPVAKNSTVAAANMAATGGDNQFAISEYLMEVLPGWHVEDFLDSSSAPPFGFCKSNDAMLPFLGESNVITFSSKSSSSSVPQSPSLSMYPSHQCSSQFGGQIVSKEITGMETSRRWTDDGFTVPQINPQSKRSRLLW
ncbi:hypothetical protein SLEP1_g53938 [Rubroshorea leprosula]|uniref:B box-type domain-containing protein n=1 Tax=Rubroshorea leprosula TaxID=152421 RepID=A0AAV5MAU0_9ROSI|nr:hypothetical protein SLEP1_g53938 [Rubroshorea leprosula]